MNSLWSGAGLPGKLQKFGFLLHSWFQLQRLLCDCWGWLIHADNGFKFGLVHAFISQGEEKLMLSCKRTWLMKVLSWFNITLCVIYSRVPLLLIVLCLHVLYSLILILGFMQWVNILIMKITMFYIFNLCVSSVILFYSILVNRNW